MTKFVTAAKMFVKGEEGATMVEYGLMLALIAVVCIVAVTARYQDEHDVLLSHQFGLIRPGAGISHGTSRARPERESRVKQPNRLGQVRFQGNGKESSMPLPLAVKRFIEGEEGAAMVEYGLMLALIAVVCIVAVTALGTKTSMMFSSVTASI